MTSERVLILEGTSYLMGDTVRFTCSAESVYRSGDLVSLCTDRGAWSGEKVICTVPTTVQPTSKACSCVFLCPLSCEQRHMCSCDVQQCNDIVYYLIYFLALVSGSNQVMQAIGSLNIHMFVCVTFVLTQLIMG